MTENQDPSPGETPVVRIPREYGADSITVLEGLAAAVRERRRVLATTEPS